MLLASPPLSVYVHVPWCVRKCPYCDFNSHERNGVMPVDAYVDALLADLDRDLENFSGAIAGRAPVSIFFGGGTPSLFAPFAIARILDGIAARMPLASDVEITLETNPGTIEHGRFEGYLDAGVNRLSLGVQSFDDDALRRIGRIHSASDAIRAVESAQAAGYSNINLDLMYALPGQTVASALADVDQALALLPAHLSHYQLTLEPNTLFAARPPVLPDSDQAWDMQEACQARLAAGGYAQYEVSAYAQSGRECAHNLNYWRFGDYLGIGAGAHGKITDIANGAIDRTTKVRLPRSYLERASRGDAFGKIDRVHVAELPFEFVLNALRLNQGTTIAEFEARTGVSRIEIEAPLRAAHANGWLDEDRSRMLPSETGRRFLNDLVALFMAE